MVQLALAGSGRGGKAQRHQPQVARQPAGGRNGAPVALDARPAAAQQGRGAQQLFGQEEWAKGFEALDRLLASAVPSAPHGPDAVRTATFHAADGIRHVPLHLALRRLLLELPPAAIDVYRRTYEAPAREQLASALGQPFVESLDALDAIASRYPATDAAIDALSALGDRALDLGQPARAAKAFAAAIDLARVVRNGSGDETSAPDGDDLDRRLTVLLVKSALASALSGRPRRATALLEEAVERGAGSTVTVAGETVGLEDLPERLLARYLRSTDAIAARVSTDAADPSTSLGCRASWIHSPAGRLEEASASGADEGDTDGVDDPDAVARPAVGRRTPLRRTDPGRAFPPTRVTAAGGRILIRNDAALLALDAATGKIGWTAPVSVSTAASRAGVTGDRGGRDVGVVRRPGDATLVVVVDPRSPPALDQNDKLVLAPNALASFDLDDGSSAWRLGGAGSFPKILRSVTFTAPPTRASDRVLVAPAFRADGMHVVALTPDGEFLWISKVHGHDAALLKRDRTVALRTARLAVGDGLCIAQPGDGAVAAIEIASGAVRWISRYRTLGAVSSGNVSRALWAPADPAIEAGVAVVAPPDSSWLVGFDLDGGQTIWERNWSGDVFQFLGTADGLAFVSGGVVEAIDVATGETRWRSSPLEFAAGHGVLAGSRIYLPLEDEIAVLECATGRLVSRTGFSDPRTPEPRPGNLALARIPDGAASHGLDRGAPAARLVAVGAWGVALMEPFEQTRSSIDALRDEGTTRARARLLAAEGRDEAALRLLAAELESGADVEPSPERRAELTALIIDIALGAAIRRGDPGPITTVLAMSGLELDTAVAVMLRIELAGLLERSDPARAAKIYRDVIRRLEARSPPSPVDTPEGTRAAPDVYCADSLRRLVLSGLAPEPEEDAMELRARLDGVPADAGEARAALRSLALERPWVREAAAALARLARLHAARGDLAATASAIERLRAYPGLGANDFLADLGLRFADSLHPPERLPAELRPALEPVLEWKQAFWKANEGFLVATATGSEPLEWIPVLKQGKLRLFSAAGELAAEVDLVDYPDVEKAKSALQSHLEEPALALGRAEDVVLFTAAGVYQLRGPKLESIGWRHTYAHPLDTLFKKHQRSGWSVATLSRITGNIFATPIVTPDRREGVILMPDGELFSVDLATGKVVYRVGDVERVPFGSPRLVGHEVLAPTVEPAGLVSYSLLHRGARSLAAGDAEVIRASYESTASDIFRWARVPDFAIALDTQRGVEVLDDRTRRLLWRENATRETPSLVRAGADVVWVADPAGELVARSTFGGRRVWSLPIPRNAMPVASYRADTVEADGPATRAFWIALAIDAPPPGVRSFTPITQTGSELRLLRVSEDGQLLAETRVGGRGVTFTGQRWVLGDRWVLAYNEVDEKGRWLSRVSGFDPASGDLRALLEAPISGKGTGLPPTLAVVRGGEDRALALAVGNATGFGLFGTRVRMVQQMLIAEGAIWRYFPGTAEPSPGLEWTALDFDDSGWKEGPSGFGYGDDDDATVLDDMQGNYTTLFIRHVVEVEDPARFENVILSVKSDDGFVAYINGEEAGRFRAGAPGERLPHTATGQEAREPLVADEVDVKEHLVAGRNILALFGINRSPTSSDFTLIPVLRGEINPLRPTAKKDAGPAGGDADDRDGKSGDVDEKSEADVEEKETVERKGR